MLAVKLGCALSVVFALAGCTAPPETSPAPGAPSSAAIDAQGTVTLPDGTRLAVHVVGSGTRVVVVPLASWLSPGVDDLAVDGTGRRLVLYDPRGRGASSDVPPSGAGLARDVEDLEHLRRALGVERWSIVGWSYHAAVAAHYALAHPERVERLVLVSPLPTRRDPLWNLAAAAFEERVDAQARARLAADLRAERDPVRFCREWARLHVPAQVHRDVDLEPLIDRLCELENERPDRVLAHMQATFDDLGAWDWREPLAQLGTPALVLQGSRDFVQPSSAREWAELLPNGSFLLLDDVGRLPWLEAPSTFLAAAGGFLPRAPGAPSTSQAARWLTASALLDAPALGAGEAVLGRVEDVLLEPETGCPALAVLAGNDDPARRALVPIGRARWDPDGMALRLDATAEAELARPEAWTSADTVPLEHGGTRRAVEGLGARSARSAFAARPPRELQGRVHAVEEWEPELDPARHVLVRLRDDGNRYHRVLLAPAAWLAERDAVPRTDETLRVEAVEARDGSGRLWIAARVAVVASPPRWLALRDERGVGAWNGSEPPPAAPLSLSGLLGLPVQLDDELVGRVGEVVLDLSGAGPTRLAVSSDRGARPVVLPLGAARVAPDGIVVAAPAWEQALRAREPLTPVATPAVPEATP